MTCQVRKLRQLGLVAETLKLALATTLKSKLTAINASTVTAFVAASAWVLWLNMGLLTVNISSHSRDLRSSLVE